MSKSNSKLILNTDNIAGYTQPNMPFTGVKSLELVFDGAEISFTEVNSSYGDSSVAAASYSGLKDPAFYIKNDGDSPELHRSSIRRGTAACGYAFSVFTFNPEVTVLGKYHVGETKLKDFNNEYLDSGGVKVKGQVVYCSSNDDAKFGYQLSFIAQDVGDLENASAQQLGNAVLSEAYFFVANRRLRKKPTLSSSEGLTMATKAKWAGKASGLFRTRNKQGSSKTLVSPIEILIADQTSSSSALSSYLYLIENCFHNNSVVHLKDLATKVFEQHADKSSSFYFDALSGYTGEFTQASFVLIQDWKQDINDTVHGITTMLGDRLKQKIPGSETFGSVGISHPDYIPAVKAALIKDGIELTILDNGSDQLFLLMFEVAKKAEIEKHIAIVQAE